MRFIRVGLGVCLAAALSGCGAGGVLGLNPRAAGNIVVSNPTTGAPIVTSYASPYTIASGGFSIAISENNFSGPYTVNVIAWTAPFSMPCFVPHAVPSSTSTKQNVWLFSADNAAPVATPTQASPCNAFYAGGAFQGTEETVHIGDNDGHTATFYYKLGSP